MLAADGLSEDTSPDFKRLRIDVVSATESEPERARYAALDAASSNP